MNEQLQQLISVSNQDLDKLDTSNIDNLQIENFPCYHGASGREHYRLLIFISHIFNNKILFDVGTNQCRSAIALSDNKNNQIKSYDLIQILPTNPIIDNVQFILGNTTDDKDLYNCPFIFLDVDHDGTYENIFYNFLKEIKWKGILMLDDIHLNEAMQVFWKSISEEKYDLTSKGHWSGTGLVIFK